MIRSWLYVVAMIFLLFSCSGNSGKLLSVSKMKFVMWDMMQADYFSNMYLRRDSTKNLNHENLLLQQKIFLRHQVTREQYYYTLEQFKKSPETMKALMDSITVLAEKERSLMLQQRYGSPSNALPANN